MSLSHAIIGGIYALIGHLHSYAIEMKELLPHDSGLRLYQVESAIDTYAHDWINAITQCMFQKRIDSLTSIESLPSEIEQIKTNGFSESEFADTKKEIESLSNADHLSSHANYVPYSFSLPLTENLLDMISVEDISENFKNLLIEDPSAFALRISESSDVSSDFNETQNIPSAASNASLKEALANAQTLQDPHLENPFFTLPLNEGERKIIASIITTMAEKNVLKLGLMKRTLEKRGKKIHHVHPFRFLGYVFSTPHLKTSMHKIRKSGFKWDGFMDGFAKKMSDEAHHGNLTPYVPGFCQFLNISEAHVMEYVHRHDWEGLVRFLL